MRDLIWTLIVIWLVYQLIALFKGKSANADRSHSYSSSSESNSQKPEGTKKAEIKRAVQQHLNKEGEYVDFEEVK